MRCEREEVEKEGEKRVWQVVSSRAGGAVGRWHSHWGDAAIRLTALLGLSMPPTSHTRDHEDEQGCTAAD